MTAEGIVGELSVRERHFCTYFDSRYLLRALCMYDSLIRHHRDAVLHCYTFDDDSTAMLRAMALPRTTVVTVADFETDELRRVKATRSPYEYMWTCTPSILQDCLRRNPGIEGTTYLDADLVFFNDPEVIFREAGDASVILSPHYPSRESGLPEVPRWGRFCVQFCYFRNDPRARAPLDRWTRECISWCYGRLEDGKFGDQKYLDPYPDDFPGVHAIQNRSYALGPWSTPSGLTRDDDGSLLLRGSPVIFYHYHGFAPLSFDRYRLTRGFRVHPDAAREFYGTLIQAYQDAHLQVTKRFPAFPFHTQTVKRMRLGAAGDILLRVLGKAPVVQVPPRPDRP